MYVYKDKEWDFRKQALCQGNLTITHTYEFSNELKNKNVNIKKSIYLQIQQKTMTGSYAILFENDGNYCFLQQQEMLVTGGIIFFFTSGTKLQIFLNYAFFVFAF